jgi:beta-lactam-binding protein with PASTA domain
VPLQILEISNDKKTGKVIEKYSAKELNVKKGDYIEKVKSINGCTWSKKVDTNEEVWIPDGIIEQNKRY